MTIRFHCGHCNAVIRAKDSLAGSARRCPKCKGAIEVPSHSEDARSIGDMFDDLPDVSAPAEPEGDPPSEPTELFRSYAADLVQRHTPERQRQAPVSAATLRAWAPFGESLNYVYLGALGWVAALGAPVLALCLVVALAACGLPMAGVGAVVGIGESEQLGIDPGSAAGRTSIVSYAAGFFILTVAGVLTAILRYVLTAHEEYFWPFVAFLFVSFVLLLGICVGGGKVIAWAMACALLASQVVIVVGLARCLQIPGVTGKALVGGSILSLTISIALAVVSGISMGRHTAHENGADPAQPPSKSYAQLGTSVGFLAGSAAVTYALLGTALGLAVMKLRRADALWKPIGMAAFQIALVLAAVAASNVILSGSLLLALIIISTAMFLDAVIVLLIVNDLRNVILDIA